MSLPEGVEAAVERLWPGQESRLEVLGGGITNHNVRIDLDDGSAYVLRVAGSDTELLGIDRRAEHEATCAAAAVGVGPEVVDFLEPEGWLVTRFIVGDVPPIERLRSPDGLAEVGRTLRIVHAGPPVPVTFDSFRVIEDYRATAVERGGGPPDGVAWLWEIAAQIRARRGGAAQCPCHNDLLTANLLDDGERLRIVDWEYAGMGDPYFELANLAVKNGFGETDEAALLEGYWGAATPERRRALRLMRVMASYWEGMWGVLQATVSELDFDFRGYASEHLGRALAEAGRIRAG